MCCHLALLGLAQGKPSWSAQACTGQAQAELDDNTCAVYPAPECTVYRAMKRKHPSFLPFSAFFLRLAFQSVVRSSSLSLSLSVLEPLSQSVRFGKRNYELREGRIYLQRLRTAKSTHGRDGEASGGHARNWQFCNRKSKAHLIASMCYGLPFLLGERERERERESATLFWCSD